MNRELYIYREHRDALLTKIVETLARDERFVAGWLTGSFVSGLADSISDIDICIVVADLYSETFCQRLDQPMSQTSAERYSLFSQFGTPALIHENNNNAPEAGTFTFVLYSKSAIMADWTLIPQSKAKRPVQSILLFEKMEIPIALPPEPENLDQSKKAVAETWAFFWMMTAITVKYIFRGDSVFAAQWIESLHRIVQEIKRHLERKPWLYTRGSLSSLQATPETQLKSIRELCNHMLELKHRVSEFIGAEPLTPIAEIEELFALVQNANPPPKITNLRS